jgi:hypothetical protein
VIGEILRANVKKRVADTRGGPYIAPSLGDGLAARAFGLRFAKLLTGRQR